MKILVEVLVIAVLLLGVRAYMVRGTVTGPAPDFTGTTLAGGPVSLSGLRGEPLLLHFWATWCPVCRAEQGSITAIAKDHRVLTVAMQSGDARAVKQYLEEQEWDVPVLVDEDGGLARAYGVRAVPTTFVLDRHGEIRAREVGYTTEIGLRLRLWWAGRPFQGGNRLAPVTSSIMGIMPEGN